MLDKRPQCRRLQTGSSMAANWAVRVRRLLRVLDPSDGLTMVLRSCLRQPTSGAACDFEYRGDFVMVSISRRKEAIDQHGIVEKKLVKARTVRGSNRRPVVGTGTERA